MDRFRRIRSIVYKDILDSLKNKTVLIVILLPVLASLFFSIVNNNDIDKVFNVGVVEGSSSFNRFLADVNNLKTIPYMNGNEGINSLENGKIDAFIEENGDDEFKVYLDSSQALTYYFLKDSLQELIEIYLNIRGSNIEFVALNTDISTLSFLPVWITITVTMIGVLIVSGGFAEEKENKTLYSIIITPASKLEILLGKGIFGVLFTFITILIMCLLNGVYSIGIINLLKLVVVIIVASISFTSIGLLIGSFTESQSSARSIGTIIYFPLLFPTLIADLSNFTRTLAGFFPTHYLYNILEKLLIYQGQVSIYRDMFILFLFALILSSISFFKFRQVS